ncbi:hypothetical protein FNH05_15150 [Amycolatopsis rhizosphaerae]|uniref:Uncharacterized protein n=1 Tax=Amycolatopsis rhizosphaerae TaxID=2053003 RepID=A0A558CRG3_9PSEU|nr:hypothetical protein [Amycolatopsis rhizosphaerae]TVT51354.1 hypothetical protein FNH05_15150 [Amycolatopsis rhizosphaerae]
MRLKFRRPGFFKPQPEFTVSFARVCRDCGVLLPFLDEQSRRRLDETAEQLLEVEDWDDDYQA